MPFESVDSSSAESRSRMISFRVTSEEYTRFRELCALRGLRNVSEVVRLAVSQLQSENMANSGEHTLQLRIDTLETRIAALESRLDLVPSVNLNRATRSAGGGH